MKSDFISRLREEAGITNSEIINCVKESCPKFTKIQLSMAGKPEYGVQLSTKARRSLRDRYPEKKPKHDPKKHRLEISVSEDAFKRLKTAAEKCGRTVPQFVLELVNAFVKGD